MNIFLSRISKYTIDTDKIFKKIKPDLYSFISDYDINELVEYSLPELINDFNQSIDISDYLSEKDIRYINSQDKITTFIPKLLMDNDYKKIIINDLTQWLQKTYKLLCFSSHGQVELSPQTISFIHNRFYPYMRKAIRGIIASLNNKPIKASSPDNIMDTYIIPALRDTKIVESLNMSEIEDWLFMDYIVQKYHNIIISYINKYIRRTDKNSNLLDQLHKYIIPRLRKIFLKFNIGKDVNNMYAQSWIDTFGNLPHTKEYELKYLTEYLYNNYSTINQDLDLPIPSYQTWRKLVDTYILSHADQLAPKIYDLLSAKNSQLKKERAIDLLNLNDDDKIGVKDSTTIDYDITNDYVRNRPIIIVKDINTRQDYVFFGPAGSSHGFYVANKLAADCQAKNIQVDETYLGYGYLLGNIAFLDENPDNLLIGYTNAELLQILKNDPRIKKVYTTPPHRGQGGPITRLAKLIKW